MTLNARLQKATHDLIKANRELMDASDQLMYAKRAAADAFMKADGISNQLLYMVGRILGLESNVMQQQSKVNECIQIQNRIVAMMQGQTDQSEQD